MDRPKLKRDWVGLRVRARRDLKNAHGIIAAGATLVVYGSHGGLKMTADRCDCCGYRPSITGVSEDSVDIVGPA